MRPHRLGCSRCQAVNSPNVKLLYDIYHMQIMEGDLVATIRENIPGSGTSIPAECRGGMNWMRLRKCSGQLSCGRLQT